MTIYQEEMQRKAQRYGCITDYDEADQLLLISHASITRMLTHISWASCTVLNGWFEPTTNNIIYATNGMPDIGADDMYNNATEKGTIDTIPEIPGLAVWHEGHIGIYIGNGEVIHAANTNAGVIKTPIGDSGWTHWLKIPYITYAEETAE